MPKPDHKPSAAGFPVWAQPWVLETWEVSLEYKLCMSVLDLPLLCGLRQQVYCHSSGAPRSKLKVASAGWLLLGFRWSPSGLSTSSPLYGCLFGSTFLNKDTSQFRGHPAPAWTLSELVTPAMTLSPDKVTFRGPGVRASPRECQGHKVHLSQTGYSVCFPDCDVHVHCLGTLLRWRFSFRRSGARHEPAFLTGVPRLRIRLYLGIIVGGIVVGKKVIFYKEMQVDIFKAKM